MILEGNLLPQLLDELKQEIFEQWVNTSDESDDLRGQARAINKVLFGLRSKAQAIVDG